MMECHWSPIWSIKTVLTEDGKMKLLDHIPDQTDQDPMDHDDIDEPIWLGEGYRPRLINPRTTQVNRHAIRLCIDMSIKDTLGRP